MTEIVNNKYGGPISKAPKHYIPAFDYKVVPENVKTYTDRPIKDLSKVPGLVGTNQNLKTDFKEFYSNVALSTLSGLIFSSMIPELSPKQPSYWFVSFFIAGMFFYAQKEYMLA